MGILAKLFGRKAAKSDEPMSAQSAVEIIQRFCAVLEHEAPAPGCVADASKLPFPKDRIRQALIIGLRASSDSKMKEMLKVAFLELANWQPGVGTSDIGLDTSKLDMAGDVEALARAVLNQTEGQEKWQQEVKAEQAASKRQLEGLGLW